MEDPLQHMLQLFLIQYNHDDSVCYAFSEYQLDSDDG